MTSSPFGSTWLAISDTGFAVAVFVAAAPCAKGSDLVGCAASGAMSEIVSARITKIRFTLTPHCCLRVSKRIYHKGSQRCRVSPALCLIFDLSFVISCQSERFDVMREKMDVRLNVGVRTASGSDRIIFHFPFDIFHLPFVSDASSCVFREQLDS